MIFPPPDTTASALALFAGASTTPAERRSALTALITAKVLPKQADDPAVLAGRAHLLAQIHDAAEPGHRLLAIAESIRLGQVVKRWAKEIAEWLRPAFVAELPEMQLLTEADDRLNLARACAQMSAPWLPTYLADSIANEETGEKARAEMIAALLDRSTNLGEALRTLVTAFEALRPSTEAPGDTVARRLTRTLSALRDALLESELEASENPGKALYELLAIPLSTVGRPQEDKVQLDLSREALLTVHDIVRTRISVVADPQMYRVVDYCRKLCGGRSWPDELRKPLERLITDVTEALVLLGRQGQHDQALLAQLDVLCNHPERARSVARDLAARHPEVHEDVRYWLEHGRMRVTRQSSESAIEAAASNADESIGLALQAARQARLLGDSLREPLASNLEIYEPGLAPAAQELLSRVQVLAVQVEQAASLRGLGLYGTPGELVEMSTKFFTVVGESPRQRMIVKQPAVVRKRPDGSVGDVVTKGLVE
ncbi:MAG: hypothetical protein PHX69_05685 [Simplicispira sp.]|uniref:hypothetical protein n=1 Tax=Simplicispira sp. TaxID=2015802 RepID=UPI0025889AC0|nr:hypothetical protein [Simplicispira sp.]MDD2691261.1 hypothetical protein [Simplicispira sp.]